MDVQSCGVELRALGQRRSSPSGSGTAGARPDDPADLQSITDPDTAEQEAERLEPERSLKLLAGERRSSARRCASSSRETSRRRRRRSPRKTGRRWTCSRRISPAAQETSGGERSPRREGSRSKTTSLRPTWSPSPSPRRRWVDMRSTPELGIQSSAMGLGKKKRPASRLVAADSMASMSDFGDLDMSAGSSRSRSRSRSWSWSRSRSLTGHRQGLHGAAKRGAEHFALHTRCRCATLEAVDPTARAGVRDRSRPPGS